MKLSRLVVSVAALMAGLNAVSAEISTSSNVEVLALDGQKIGGGLLKKNKLTSISDNQVHQLVVRVTEVIRSGSDRRLFESSPIVVKFKAGSENIVLKAASLMDENGVSKFEKNPKISLVSGEGQILASEQGYLLQDGIFPGANITEDLAAYNSSGGKAAVAKFATTSMPVALGMTSVGKASKGQVTVQGENVAEQQLQYWFQQADKATQQRFLNWAKQY